ncbi:MAG: Ni/Fe hydrogenase subunit alpha [Anaerolineae bacterium]
MTRKVMIEPVTRIEGHAKVSIYIGDDGKVERALLHVNEFRGFEKFSEGRMFFEMPSITPRICGICPVSHHLAAAKAADGVAGVVPPRPASLLRELMHMGQVIQSHSMHFFELAGPDLLLGFDADPAKRNVAGLIEANPQLALKGVGLRKYGQEVIRLLGEKRVHPKFAVVGGVNAPLSAATRDIMLANHAEMVGYARDGIAIAKRWLDENQDYAEKFASFPCGYLGTVAADGGLNLYEGKLRLIDCDGKLLDQFSACDYAQYIGERVEPWSYLKFPFYRKMGWPDGVYRVGPLARLNVADHIGTPLAGKEMLEWKSVGRGKPVQGTLYYHYARMIEALYALEHLEQLLADPEIMSTDIVSVSNGITGHGVGCLEAPRGTLMHDYHTDADGKLTAVNLIIATGHNNWAMTKSVDEVAKAYIDGNHLTEGMLNRVEAAVRAHDPCLSCSTHAVGQMPMEVTLIDAAGNVIDRKVRG